MEQRTRNGKFGEMFALNGTAGHNFVPLNIQKIGQICCTVKSDNLIQIFNFHFTVAGLILLFLFSFLLCTFGLIGNLLVLLAIIIERRLQNQTNYFLFSLALADLLVCFLVMPVSILTELTIGFTWEWTFSSCLFFLYTDVFLCSASIVHMTVISLDRYLGISQPLKRHRNRQRRTVTLKIIFVWFLTTLITSPLAILSFFDSQIILFGNECGIRSRSFMLYGSTFSFLIPVVVLSVTTRRTTKLLKQQAKTLCNRKGINELRRMIMPARPKFGRLDSNNLSTGSRSSQSVTHLEKASNISSPELVAADHQISPNPPKRIFQRQQTLSERRHSSIFAGKVESDMDSMKFGNNSRKHRRRMTGSKKALLASEQKATRVLIVQIVCFFVCWTPFFMQNIILGICGFQRCGQWFPRWFSLSAVWFGYFSSVLNPIIYTIFNKRFREAFISIIQCRHWTFRRDSSSTKFWFTLTEAQGLNSTLNSLAQKFSRRAEQQAWIARQNPHFAKRRSSYAGEMTTILQYQTTITQHKRPTTVRRSTLTIPTEYTQTNRFVTRRLSTGANAPYSSYLGRQSPMGERLIRSPRLYTISDSEEDDLDRMTLSIESKSEETSRRSSKIDVSQFAKNFMRKVSWRRIGRSASLLHQIGVEKSEIHRKITPHILFPVDLQEMIAFGSGRTSRIKMASEQSLKLDLRDRDFLMNGSATISVVEEDNELNNEQQHQQQQEDNSTLQSVSMMSTAEEFFAQRIHEIHFTKITI